MKWNLRQILNSTRLRYITIKVLLSLTIGMILELVGVIVDLQS